MIIQHNLPAINAHRQMGINNSNISKSLEKLSSGYRINKAGDDAAGLAISEKMRGQISGLTQAVRNSQDGISLIQTAEGALNETHSILQRMRELSVQSANGTYDDTTDRKQINKEMDSLKAEIDRISTATEFNGKKLLDGTMGGITGTSVSKAVDGQTFTFSTEGWKAVKDDPTAATKGTSTKIETAHKGPAATADLAKAINVTITDNAVKIEFVNATDSAKAAVASEFSAEEINAAIAKAITVNNAKTTPNKLEATSIKIDKGISLDKDGKILGGSTAAGVTFADFGGTLDSVAKAGEDLTLQIGANGSEDQRVALSVSDMSSKGIGVATLSTATRSQANDAIAAIDNATNYVSSTRADLGALQNRLDHTIANLGVTKENLTASESRIRDVDMASEMMSFTKNQILAQASQAMLAQANALPQGVLQLLQ